MHAVCHGPKSGGRDTVWTLVMEPSRICHGPFIVRLVSGGLAVRGQTLGEAAILVREANERMIRHIPIPRARRRLSTRLTHWLLLAPSAVFLIGFTYWPVLQVVASSFTVHDFGHGTIVPSLALALALAVALRETTRFAMLLRTVIALPMLVPLVAASALFVFVFLPGAGLLDHYLAVLGSGWSDTNWLGDPSLALGSIVAVTIWKNTGYYMLFFLAGLAGIPDELLDAAKIDGAGAVQRFIRITLPLLGPTLAFVLIIALLNVLTQVDHVIVMTQGGPSDSTMLVLYYIFQQAHQNYDIGLASAATVISVAFLFALSMISLRSLERGIHYET
jgi:sn-glycerol 3-phosphate transport system permease protein